MLLNYTSLQLRVHAYTLSISENTAHDGLVSGLCFTADGLHLVSFGSDNRMRVWNTSTGLNELINFGKIYNDCRKNVKFAISQNTTPDIVYIPSESNISVFNLSTGDQIGSLSGHYNPVNCVYFDAQDQTLYSGGNDRNLLIWTPETEAVIAYQDSFQENSHQENHNGTASSERIGTADAWSSDED